MSGQTEITLNTKQEVTIIRTELLYTIPRRDWNRLSKAINGVKPYNPIWSSIAWGSLGIGVSCVLSWFTNMSSLFLIILGSIAFGVAICAFFSIKGEKNVFLEPVNHLHEVIQEIQDEVIDTNDHRNNS